MSEPHEIDVRRENFRPLLDDSEGCQTLNPIIGYAQEPLLPLADACASLADIIYDIFTYVTVALENTPKYPADGLTRDESASIRLYTMKWPDAHESLSWSLNQTLRRANVEDLRKWFKYLKLFLTALTKIPCVPPQTVWRGIPTNISHEFLTGTQLTLRAFSSCTTSLIVLESDAYLGNEGERTLLSIEVFNGRRIRDHSQYGTDDEIILLPGTYVQVQAQHSPAPGLHIVHLQQKIPEEILLEPPFEGILKIFNDSIMIEIYLYLGACLYPTIK
ncbi:unnamed protein product [Rotaria sp. Silwood2]|nr:unnamed protein product [Rotaria sp. Silwood2]CAF3303193.1 unnamed protein product [Rotaria sp. Silwood2]CAF3306382.1 unnamed protein product [Rotaria sp. Silwood2]CAF4195041.1 unnamed protein product [Rotaria sp. Silwood2]CAF4200785.1 unnamed protein product [Rotaria sp. Silwood2]